MNDRNGMINQIIDLLGSGGDREIATKVYEKLRADRRIDYSDAQGLHFTQEVDLVEVAAQILADPATPKSNRPVEIVIDASRYEDSDDCLSDAASDYAESHDLAGWDLSPRWADNSRREIILTVPAFAS